MGYEEIFEQIEVITHFRDGKVLPLKFRWNGRTYRVKRINTQWKDPLGAAQEIHYSIHCSDDNCFELVFDCGTLSWQIARIYLEG